MLTKEREMNAIVNVCFKITYLNIVWFFIAVCSKYRQKSSTFLFQRSAPFFKDFKVEHVHKNCHHRLHYKTESADLLPMIVVALWSFSHSGRVNNVWKVLCFCWIPHQTFTIFAMFDQLSEYFRVSEQARMFKLFSSLLKSFLNTDSRKVGNPKPFGCFLLIKNWRWRFL